MAFIHSLTWSFVLVVSVIVRNGHELQDGSSMEQVVFGHQGFMKPINHAKEGVPALLNC